MFFQQQQQEPDTKLYDILNVSKNSPAVDIKKSYKKLAMIWHPDRNKDDKEVAETKFKDISMAYDILGDEDKRKSYDQFGLEGMKQMNHGGGGQNPFDMFSGMFGGHGHGQQRARAPPSKNEILNVTLSQIYNNETVNFSLKKQVLCSDCLGVGAKTRSSYIRCQDCNGTGQILKVMQLGPGFMTQTQSPCNKCAGRGKSIKDGDECKTCNTHKVVKIKKSYSVELKNTFSDGHQIIIKGEGDQYPELNSYGDLIIQLYCKNHTKFKLDGYDLHYIYDMSLIDALCGSKFNITHLDNRVLLMESAEIIEPNMRKVIIGEGINSQGNLIILFNIVFPKNKRISDEKKTYIRKLLATHINDNSTVITENVHERSMMDYISHKSNNNNNNTTNNNTNDSQSHMDAEDNSQHIGCAQQ